MEILSAEFVISNTKVDKCPQGNLPEYAFIGRSNVGKSSLLNALAPIQADTVCLHLGDPSRAGVITANESSPRALTLIMPMILEE